MLVGQAGHAPAPGRPGQKAHLHQIRLTQVLQRHGFFAQSRRQRLQNAQQDAAQKGAIEAPNTAQLDRVEGKDNMQFTAVVLCQKSTDGGRIWGDYTTVFPEEGTFCRQPIQVLSNGRWIFANWLCTDSAEGLSGDPTAFRISDDEGKTWRMVMMPGSNGHVHANVIELEPGHLVAFMRNREAYRIHRSESFDWGETWTVPAPTPLPNNNSSISAVKLQSGRIAIAYNPTCTPNPVPGKAAWPGLRCPVAVALSEDGGLTFPIIRWMERGEGYMGDENKTNNKQYEYPYLMQGRDGMLHLAYAARTRQGIKYVRFSEQDVLGEDWVNICNSSIQEQMAANTDVSYFSEDQGGFTTVDENTSFYLDEDGSVVVVFPKYSIAPGAYGEQTFRIDA